jgi:hypothetical protein
MNDAQCYRFAQVLIKDLDRQINALDEVPRQPSHIEVGEAVFYEN